MNTNRLINMIVRMFVRKAMNYGMNAGTKALSKNDSAGRARPQQNHKNQDAAPQFDARGARKVMRMTRRMSKF